MVIPRGVEVHILDKVNRDVGKKSRSVLLHRILDGDSCMFHSL